MSAGETPSSSVPLRSALISDVLDSLGSVAHCLGWDIVCVNGDQPLAGRAYPVDCIEVPTRPAEPYLGLLDALDGIGAGEIFVVPTSRSTAAAVWGELVTTACRARGAVGALTDGLARDSGRLREVGAAFPVYARGTLPHDIAGRLEIAGVATSIEIDGVTIGRGDLVVADGDGVVVVPGRLEHDVLRLAAEKDAGEDEFRAAVADGMLPSAAYRQFGVL